MFGGTDSDGDGIYDKDDECPETPGLPEFNGCPDSDGDGIEDRMDACPNEAGLAEFDGCPDTDGDGIADPNDDCPEVSGLAELNGCPDADGDGVADNEDDCPNEAGPAENNGCPYEDMDGDGVLDKDDDCPEVAGTAANNGCPEPDVEVISELNEYSKTVLFDLNKATIRDESEEALQSIADIMNEYSNTIFHIEGHTDSTGSAEYNEKLSRERAASVEKWLEENGVPSNRLTSEGYGEERPIATNNTAAGRQDNRRVEISLDKNKEVKDSDSSME
jgi:outer membrane protein OmpA-like peptidoglycan-associated protein